MAKNATLRIRAISSANLNDILEMIDMVSKGVEIVEQHDTREEPPTSG